MLTENGKLWSGQSGITAHYRGWILCARPERPKRFVAMSLDDEPSLQGFGNQMFLNDPNVVYELCPIYQADVTDTARWDLKLDHTSVECQAVTLSCGQVPWPPLGMGHIVQYHLWGGADPDIITVDGASGSIVLPPDNQIDFLVPVDAASGPAQLSIVRPGRTGPFGKAFLGPIAPGLFTKTANARGAVMGQANGAPISGCDASGCFTLPIVVCPDGSTRVILPATGIPLVQGPVANSVRINIQ